MQHLIALKEYKKAIRSTVKVDYRTSERAFFEAIDPLLTQLFFFEEGKNVLNLLKERQWQPIAKFMGVVESAEIYKE